MIVFGIRYIGPPDDSSSPNKAVKRSRLGLHAGSNQAQHNSLTLSLTAPITLDNLKTLYPSSKGELFLWTLACKESVVHAPPKGCDPLETLPSTHAERWNTGLSSRVHYVGPLELIEELIEVALCPRPNVGLYNMSITYE